MLMVSDCFVAMVSSSIRPFQVSGILQRCTDLVKIAHKQKQFFLQEVGRLPCPSIRGSPWETDEAVSLQWTAPGRSRNLLATIQTESSYLVLQLGASCEAATALTADQWSVQSSFDLPAPPGDQFN